MPASTIPDLPRRIAEGDFESLDRLCAEYGIALPKLVWTPRADDIDQEPLRFLMRYWHGLRAGADAPRATIIDPVAMRPVLGYIMLLDVLDGGVDFRYRLYGSGIAARAGFDLTGKCVSDVKTGVGIATFFMNVYRAVLIRAEPIYTEHQPPATISVTTWYRLILPLALTDGTIGRLLVGNMPGDWRQPKAAAT